MFRELNREERGEYTDGEYKHPCSAANAVSFWNLRLLLRRPPEFGRLEPRGGNGGMTAFWGVFGIACRNSPDDGCASFAAAGDASTVMEGEPGCAHQARVGEVPK